MHLNNRFKVETIPSTYPDSPSSFPDKTTSLSFAKQTSKRTKRPVTIYDRYALIGEPNQWIMSPDYKVSEISLQTVKEGSLLEKLTLQAKYLPDSSGFLFALTHTDSDSCLNKHPHWDVISRLPHTFIYSYPCHVSIDTILKQMKHIETRHMTLAGDYERVAGWVPGRSGADFIPRDAFELPVDQDSDSTTQLIFAFRADAPTIPVGFARFRRSVRLEQLGVATVFYECVCERMYVSPNMRGLGYGAILAQARSKLVIADLDTLINGLWDIPTRLKPSICAEAYSAGGERTALRTLSRVQSHLRECLQNLETRKGALQLDLSGIDGVIGCAETLLRIS